MEFKDIHVGRWYWVKTHGSPDRMRRKCIWKGDTTVMLLVDCDRATEISPDSVMMETPAPKWWQWS